MPAAKALLFRFLRSLTVSKIPLGKSAWTELVCYLNGLFVSQRQFEFSKQNTFAAHFQQEMTMAKELFESCMQELLKELCSKRFSLKAHCTAKSIAPSFSW